MVLGRVGAVLLFGQVLITPGVTSAEDSGDAARGYIYANGEAQDLDHVRSPLQFNTTGAVEGWKLDIGRTNTVFTAPADGVYSVDFSVVFSVLPRVAPAEVQVCLSVNDEWPTAPCMGVTVAPSAGELSSRSFIPASRDVFVNLVAEDRVRIIAATTSPPLRTESQTITIHRVA